MRTEARLPTLIGVPVHIVYRFGAINIYRVGAVRRPGDPTTNRGPERYRLDRLGGPPSATRATPCIEGGYG